MRGGAVKMRESGERGRERGRERDIRLFTSHEIPDAAEEGI